MRSSHRVIKSSDGESLPAMQETQVGSLHGLDNPLEKEIATYSSVLAWRFPWKVSRTKQLVNIYLRTEFLKQENLAPELVFLTMMFPCLDMLNS